MTLPFEQLIANQIRQESGGNPRAVSPAGAAGILQIMPDTARDPGFGVAPMDWEQRFNPQVNEAFGREYMQAMLSRYNNDQPRALAAYNWGAGNADKWNGDLGALPDETRNYIQSILGGNPAPMGQPPQGQAPSILPDPGAELANLLPPEPQPTGPAMSARTPAPRIGGDATAPFMEMLREAVMSRSTMAANDAEQALRRPSMLPKG